MDKQSSNPLLKIGVLGIIVSGVCCFTPLLVILLGAVGLGTFTGYLDYVLLPAACIFFIIILYSLMRKKSHGCHFSCGEVKKEK